MSKKILMFGLIAVIIICIMGNVYATFSCNMGMQASKVEVAKNSEFTVDVNISNIESERGVIALGGKIEYDKESLELVKIEGKNGWETPTEGVTYNSQTGDIAINRNTVGKETETVFQMTFKVKEASKQNLVISLKNVTVSDGTVPVSINIINQNITVTNSQGAETDNKDPNSGNKDDNIQKPSESEKPGGNTNNITNNTNTTNSKTPSTSKTNTVNKNTTKSGVLPKAGYTDSIFIIFICLGVLIAGILLIKIKLINKEMK